MGGLQREGVKKVIDRMGMDDPSAKTDPGDSGQELKTQQPKGREAVSPVTQTAVGRGRVAEVSRLGSS